MFASWEYLYCVPVVKIFKVPQCLHFLILYRLLPPDLFFLAPVFTVFKCRIHWWSLLFAGMISLLWHSSHPDSEGKFIIQRVISRREEIFRNWLEVFCRGLVYFIGYSEHCSFSLDAWPFWLIQKNKNQSMYTQRGINCTWEWIAVISTEGFLFTAQITFLCSTNLHSVIIPLLF